MPASVLFVHHRRELGGAPTSLALLISNLDRTRFEVHVFCPGGPAARLFAESGATVHTGPVAIFAHSWDRPYKGSRWLILLRELAASLPHERSFRRLLARQRFDIVHLNDSPLLPAARLAHGRAKVVCHLRGALAYDGADLRSSAVRRLLERWADAAIAIDEDVAASFRLRIPVTVVPNAVAPRPGPGRAEAKQALGLPPGRLAVGFVGFIRREKGWPEFVRAARIVADAEPDVQFVVLGGGIRPPTYFRTMRGRVYRRLRLLADEETAMRGLVRELGLEGSFSFLPFSAETGTAYRAVDVMTFPNQGVGLGRPVLEAAAYGDPVVASGSPAGADILIPGKTGILVHPGSAEALAEAILTLVREPELRDRLGHAAAEHARLHFDPRRNALLVEALYAELLAGHPDAAARSDEPRRKHPSSRPPRPPGS